MTTMHQGFPIEVEIDPKNPQLKTYFYCSKSGVRKGPYHSQEEVEREINNEIRAIPKEVLHEVPEPDNNDYSPSPF